VFEAAIGESKEKRVYFLNWAHILWVQPDEDDPGGAFDSITPENELQ